MKEPSGKTPGSRIDLPIDPLLSNIVQSLKEHSALILKASPGAGKSTRVPPALLGLTTKKILMLQPRRVAALAVASRISEEHGWPLGETVGYQVRFENRTSKATRIEIVTEALLCKKLLRDPTLAEYGIIIFDEFHERNIYSDVSLAAVRELQLLERPDLKVLVMSATLDSENLSNFLIGAPIIDVPGRVFPIQVVYDTKSQSQITNAQFITRISEKIVQALQGTDRNILVFLPGQSEILRVTTALQRLQTDNLRILPLYGSLPLSEQRKVLAQANYQKVIVATNIAETSLTIDGIDTVIDSGLSRDLESFKGRIFDTLLTSRIDLASAEQRKGRAGRQFPGRCFRLWTSLEERGFAAYQAPDITKVDLTETFLFLGTLGITDVESFSWFEAPEKYRIKNTLELMVDWGIWNSQSGITSLGRAIHEWPLPPRLALLVEEYRRRGLGAWGAEIVSILSEADFFRKQVFESSLPMACDSDLVARFLSLREPQRNGRIYEVIDQLLKKLGEPNKTRPWHEDLLEKIHRPLLPLFADRLCRRRRPLESRGVCVGQKGVTLSDNSVVREAEFFLALHGTHKPGEVDSQIEIAVPVEKQWILEDLTHHITKSESLEFNNEKNQFYRVKKQMIFDIPLTLSEPVPLTAQECRELMVPMVTSLWPKWSTHVPSIQQFLFRRNLFEKLRPPEQFTLPELTLSELNKTIEFACMGEQNLETVKNKDWAEIFTIEWPRALLDRFEKEVPSQIISAKGRSFKLAYDAYEQISVEMKIQDAFGWKTTPILGFGKVPLRLILLGPHMRPLQTTQDLSSFWQTTYKDLRPSLKARYPKHNWPENPN